jgi:hypothetical protein
VKHVRACARTGDLTTCTPPRAACTTAGQPTALPHLRADLSHFREPDADPRHISLISSATATIARGLLEPWPVPLVTPPGERPDRTRTCHRHLRELPQVRERTSLSPRFPSSFAAFQDTTHLSCQPSPRSSPAAPSSTLTGSIRSTHEAPSDHNAPFDRQRLPCDA